MATTAQAKAQAERDAMAKFEERLFKAYTDAYGFEGYNASEAKRTLRILKASASALFPGRQKRKHVLPALGKMVTASCRVIRGSK